MTMTTGARPVDPAGPSVSLTVAVPDLYGCRHVAIVGDLTAWTPIDMPFDGERFTVTLSLPRHRTWRYRFWLDERWWTNDPEADDFEQRGDGGVVSVRYT